jgi:hypothetical protein
VSVVATVGGKHTTGILLSLLLAVTVLEVSAFVAVKVLSRGTARFLFYQPPALTAAEYERYLAIRDPELGWPAPRDIGGARYDADGSRPVPAFPDPGHECVSLYGDSFTYSPEVSDAEAWGNVLAQQLGCRVANFGVEAYGTDQAVLRFERNQQDRAPVTILGFFVRDVLRNVTQYLHFDFTTMPTAFKPRFVLDGDGLRLVPLPRIAAADLSAFAERPERFLTHETFLPGSRFGPARIAFPYSVLLTRLITSERVRARIAGRPSWADFLTPGHPSRGLEVTVGIMNRFAADCGARGKHCLVVVFPSPSSYDYLATTGVSPTNDLTTALTRAGIDHLDLTAGFARHLGSRPYSELLASPEGHHDVEGDRVVASLVGEHLAARGLTPSARRRAPRSGRAPRPHARRRRPRSAPPDRRSRMRAG